MAQGIDRRQACRLIARGLAGLVVLPAGACGTLLHPERRGQRGRRLDPAIVILDAVGLIFFFVPGVIAFAVDFATGTIYLPPEEIIEVPSMDSQAAASKIERSCLRTAQIGTAAPTHQQIEQAVYRETNKMVRLDDEHVRMAALEEIDQFGPTLGRFAEES